jgi:hypothetical protein|tara:strand:+ start:244 stop:543 length:300 start_codon:yes stop_codon:yes gene_type:complete
MKLLTLEDYQKAGETFWPKYWYISKELGENAKAEDILRVMEAIGGVALKLVLEEKEGPFGFNKKIEESNSESTNAMYKDKPFENPCPGGIMVNGECCDL